MLNGIQLYKFQNNDFLPKLLTEFKISNHYITDKGIEFTSQLSKKIQILAIQGQITASTTPKVPPVFGTVFIDPNSFRNPLDVKWNWGLLAQDISALEAHRQGRDLQICFSLHGICQENDGCITSFFGDGFTTIPLTEWEKVLEKYTMANNKAIQVPPSLFIDHSWAAATEKMKNVNQLLNRGETRQALEQCLSLFESYITNPYSRSNWEACIVKWENPQRRDGLISLFSGISTFLNKIGHHRSRAERDENDQLISMPVDQYEAEIMKLMTHLAMVYLERLKSSGTLVLNDNIAENCGHFLGS